MSRSQKGSKGVGYDYWSRRPGAAHGFGPEVKDLTHRKERSLDKRIEHHALKTECEDETYDDREWVPLEEMDAR